MAPAFDLERLPTALRPLVAHALEDVDACELAIEALEAAAHRPTRAPEVLLALALVTYHEACELVLTQIEAASERALALIDEAIAGGAQETEGVEQLRRLCAESLRCERARRTGRRRIGPAGDAMERARRAWMRGEDALGAELAKVAAALWDMADEAALAAG